jgi:hypothetical protein
VRRRVPPWLGTLLLALVTGCTYGPSYTIVEKRVKPSHFKFIPVVNKEEPGAGGWRAACLYFHLAHDDGRAFICRVGIEVPMETEESGPFGVTRAQRVAARCANEAADLALGATTAATPLGLACTSFITTYTLIFERAAKGGRITRSCRPEADAAAVH